MSRARVIFKRTGKLIKFLFICIIFTICIFMLWRIFSTGTPSELKTLTPNEKLNAAYEQQGDDLYMFDQNYDNITRSDKAYGYFSVLDPVFIPDANQVQLVFRYNNSTITSMASDYSLAQVPSREETLFDVSLVFYIDLTPDNAEDNDTSKNTDTIRTVRCKPILESQDKTTLYNFYRYVFDLDCAEEEIDLDKLIEDNTLLYVDVEMFYNKDIDYGNDPYGTLWIYDCKEANHRVKLSGKDKKALGN